MAAGQFAAYIKSVSEVNLLQIDYTFMNIKGVQWTSLQLLFLQKYKKYCLVLKLFIIYQFSMRNFGKLYVFLSSPHHGVMLEGYAALLVCLFFYLSGLSWPQI